MVKVGEGRGIVEVGSAVGGLGKRAGRGRLGSYLTMLEAEMRESLHHRPVIRAKRPRLPHVGIQIWLRPVRILEAAASVYICTVKAVEGGCDAAEKAWSRRC